MTEVPERIRALVGDLVVVDEGLQWIDTASRPSVVAALGAEIAVLSHRFGADAVACWVSDDESVLAHSIAVALDVPVARADENLGLLTLDPELPGAARSVLLVATAWTMEHPLAPLASLLTNRGKTVAAAVSLLPGDDRTDGAPGYPKLVLSTS